MSNELKKLSIYHPKNRGEPKVVKKICDGNCYDKAIQGNNPATWKVIMNKAYQKNYGRKPMYFCDECLQDLIGGTWSGGGPYGSNVKKMIRI